MPPLFAGMFLGSAFVFIGNNQYQLSGLRVGKRDRVDAGELWVYRAPRASRMAILRLALRALMGRQDDSELAVANAKAFRIKTRKGHIHVATDGEVETMSTPLNYRVRPKALGVIVPKTVSDETS